MEKDKICKNAIQKWGIENQILKSVEELNELSSELIKYLNDKAFRNRKKVIAEIADAYVVLRQLEIMFGEDDCKKQVEKKLEKLEGIIQKGG